MDDCSSPIETGKEENIIYNKIKRAKEKSYGIMKKKLMKSRIEQLESDKKLNYADIKGMRYV